MENSALLGEPEPRRFIEDAPACALPAWLPLGSDWPELKERAEAHRRLLARRLQVSDVAAGLPRQFEREDKEHREALAASFAADGPAEDERTPPEERRAALIAAEEQLRAANDALDRFVREAVALIEERVSGWVGDLATRREGSADKRREAERLLAEAREDEDRVARLEQWVKRNGGVHERASFRNIPAMRFVTWDFLDETYTPPAEPEDNGMCGLRPVLVNPPSRPLWDAEQQARRVAFERQAQADEQEQHPERYLPDGSPVPTPVPAAYNEENYR
jgi:hypothetical protein